MNTNKIKDAISDIQASLLKLEVKRADQTIFEHIGAKLDEILKEVAKNEAVIPGDSELVKAATVWWKNHRPVSATEAEHLENPSVNCKGPEEQRLAEVVAKINTPTSGMVEADRPDDWIKVGDSLPKCNKLPNSLGVQVRVKIVKDFDDEPTELECYYGCRISFAPAFYLFGNVIEDVTEWRYSIEEINKDGHIATQRSTNVRTVPSKPGGW